MGNYLRLLLEQAWSFSGFMWHADKQRRDVCGKVPAVDETMAQRAVLELLTELTERVEVLGAQNARLSERLEELSSTTIKVAPGE